VRRLHAHVLEILLHSCEYIIIIMGFYSSCGLLRTQLLADELLALHLCKTGFHATIVVVYSLITTLIIPENVADVRRYILLTVAIIYEVIQLRIVFILIIVVVNASLKIEQNMKSNTIFVL